MTSVVYAGQLNSALKALVNALGDALGQNLEGEARRKQAQAFLGTLQISGINAYDAPALASILGFGGAYGPGHVFASGCGAFQILSDAEKGQFQNCVKEISDSLKEKYPELKEQYPQQLNA